MVVAALLFVFGLPIAAMATLPTKALLGMLEPGMAPYQVGLAVLLLWALLLGTAHRMAPRDDRAAAERGRELGA